MRYPLPYAFARTAGLLLEEGGGQRTLWHGGAPDPGALSEVLRRHGGGERVPRNEAAPVADARERQGRRRIRQP